MILTLVVTALMASSLGAVLTAALVGVRVDALEREHAQLRRENAALRSPPAPQPDDPDPMESPLIPAATAIPNWMRDGVSLWSRRA